MITSTVWAYKGTPFGRPDDFSHLQFPIKYLKHNPLKPYVFVSNLNEYKLYTIFVFNTLWKLLRIVYKIMVLLFYFTKFVIIILTYFAEFNLMFLEYFFTTTDGSLDTPSDI